jgi:hypothetical protein
MVNSSFAKSCEKLVLAWQPEKLNEPTTNED